jgi:hypothetical protein
MILELHGFALDLSLQAIQHGHWVALPIDHESFNRFGIRGSLKIEGQRYSLRWSSSFPTRLRLRLTLLDQSNLFHLIPGNIHGDNNAAHVRAGEFPCLTKDRTAEKNRAPLWEFRADRASHPVSILCCSKGAVGISVNPYTGDGAKVIRNGVFAALPNIFGVSSGYGNDPLTFVEKTNFTAATCDLATSGSINGEIYVIPGNGRLEAHQIIRPVYQQTREISTFKKTDEQALRALADAFVNVNWSAELGQYTNRRCQVPVDRELKPWRVIGEIGWTGGSMLAYPFALAEQIFPDLVFPKGSARIFDEICSGFNETSGLINDNAINWFTQNRPQGWNDSGINGWWSGFLPLTRDNHCAYTNAHAAWYKLRAAGLYHSPGRKSGVGPGTRVPGYDKWISTSLCVLDTAVELQRDDGAFGYIFGTHERKVIDYEGFAGCWFAAALVCAFELTQQSRYLESARRSMHYYRTFVRDLACWGSPMDTYKSVDSEGNLAFIRAARLLHESTGEDEYLQMLQEGAAYEYLWRYGFRARPECPPLAGSNWNSCGGSITSVSNPHIHPMSVIVNDDLEYLARVSGDDYHQQRADDGHAWLMNTMELYPETMGYGTYGVLSERTCPSDGLLVERYAHNGLPSSTWWSYNAWAAGCAMEALAERILHRRGESNPAGER